MGGTEHKQDKNFNESIFDDFTHESHKMICMICIFVDGTNETVPDLWIAS